MSAPEIKVDEEPEDDGIDHARLRVMQCAAACLDHVRAVSWGRATSEYTVNDQDLVVQVSIEVKCYRKKVEPT